METWELADVRDRFDQSMGNYGQLSADIKFLLELTDKYIIPNTNKARDLAKKKELEREQLSRYGKRV